MIITRKVELRVLGTPEEKNEAWSFIRSLNKDVFKAYNLVTSHQFFNDSFLERIKKTDEELSERDSKLQREIEALSDKIKKTKKKADKDKLIAKRKKIYGRVNMLNKEAREKAEQIYGTSEANSTYQLLGKRFPNMPSQVQACVNNDAVKAFKNDIFDVKLGKKTIRTYREGIPIPFQKISMRLIKDDKNEVTMRWIHNIVFSLMFGRDKSNNREIIDRAMAGMYKYCDSKIKVDRKKKKKKLFLLFCVDIPDNKEVDSDLCVGVNLGIVVPAYCSLSKGKDRLAIGNMNDLFRHRVQMQERRRRLQKHLKATKGGRGRENKLKALERLSACERNYVRTYNHMISSQIIKFALKHKAGTIKMELLEGYGDDERNKLILRNWSYYELHSMVEYKGKKYGMKVLYTDPYRISETCNCCGEYNELNLETRNDFVCKNVKCKNFNEKVFSDYNASLNNAQSLKIVTKKEQCEYYKKYQEQEA